MYETYKTLKYSLGNIAMLALFGLGLIIAYFIVLNRSSLKLSEPIMLTGSELTIQIPAGNGWHGATEWVYKDNSYILQSVFASGTEKPTAQLLCKLEIAPQKLPSTERFENQARQINGEIVETGQLDIASLSIKWAHIKNSQTKSDILFGFAELPSGRIVTIELYRFFEDVKNPQDIFEKVVNSLSFHADSLLAYGVEIVNDLKKTGIDYAWLDNKKQDIFIIAEATENPIGFLIKTYRSFDNAADADIQGTKVLFLRNPYNKGQLTSFYSNRYLNKVTLRTEDIQQQSGQGYEILIEEDKKMTVRKLNAPDNIDVYYLSEAAIPDIFADFVYQSFLKSLHDDVIVEFINSDGSIVPSLISKIPLERSVQIPQEAEYILKIEALNSSAIAELVFLNIDKQVIKTTLQQGQSYTIIRTDAENLTESFPEQAELIKNNLLENQED